MTAVLTLKSWRLIDLHAVPNTLLGERLIYRKDSCRHVSSATQSTQDYNSEHFGLHVKIMLDASGFVCFHRSHFKVVGLKSL